MTGRAKLSTRVTDGAGGSLGVLSVHLDGRRCRVACDFCYLGARDDSGAAAPDLGLLAALLAALRFDEVAVAVSEPAAAARPALAVITQAARGRAVSVTTTLQVAAANPTLFAGVGRVNLSVDPWKGAVEPSAINRLAGGLKAHQPIEVVLIVSLTTAEFASRLVDDGLLAALVELPHVDRVALNALKPPPPWCDRAFWMRTLARLEPLLRRTLDERLFLDCYVAARLLGIGGCPARPDLTPAAGGGFAFRSCVYQPAAERLVRDAAGLAEELRGFVAPGACPFPIV